MAINKNFVVKHGLEVNSNLILANADTKRVGIGSTNPQYTLDVRGGIGVTDAYVSGIATIAVGVVTDLSGTNISYSGIGTISTLYSNAGILTTINVSGASTFTDGPVLIGSTILTGTALQRLQVTGGAYVSGNVGLGTTNSGSANIAVVNTADTASLSIGQNVDGTGENHLGIWYGGTRGTGGANVFTSNGNLRFDVDGAGGTGSQIEFGWGLDPNQTQVAISSIGVGIGTTIPTSKLTVSGNVRITGVTTLGVTTATNVTLQNLSVSGISTLGSSNGIGTVTIGVGTTALYVDGNARIIGNLSVGSGTITLDGINNTINVGSGVTINGNTGIISATAFVIGVTTYVSTLGVTTTTDLTSQQLNVSGVSTLGITSTTNLTSQTLNVSGISTLGVTTATNVTLQNLNVSGVSTLGTVQISSGIVTAISGIITYYGDGSRLINTPPGNPAGSTGQIQYNSSSSFAGSSNLTFNGSDLYVSGIVSSSALNISGISTFTGGPVLIGGGTSTGTTATSLQVVGVNSSVYIGGKLGIGITTPTSPLHVVGDVNIIGISTLGITTITNLTSQQLNVSGISTLGITTITNLTSQQLNVSGGAYVSGNLGIGTTNPTSPLHVIGNSLVTGIASVGTGITMYGSTGIISATKYYGDGSSLSGIDATRIVSGLSSVTVASSSTISAYVNGSNIFNVTGTGVTMVSGKRFDVSSYSENVNFLGSVSGTTALDVGTYSVFVADISGTTSVTFQLSGAVSGRLSSATLIMRFSGTGSRSVSLAFNPKYVGGSGPTYSTTAVTDIISFFTADAGTTTYVSVIGQGFA